VSDEPIVTPLGNSRYLVTQGDQRLVAHAVVSGRYTWVSIGTHTFVVDRSPSSGGGRRATRDDEAALASPMPASVVRVNVEAGQQVSSGDVLIVLEAMKMELTIAAPRDARVKKVDCRAGELVQPGVPLIELE
jgi:3-methylcrotonyl-CoA carboxylase alpha subunit